MSGNSSIDEVWDRVAREYGFKDRNELTSLISQVEISDPSILSAFEKWRTRDGTKETLLKIIEMKNHG